MGSAQSAIEFGVEKRFTAQKGHAQELMNLNSFGVEQQIFFSFPSLSSPNGQQKYFTRGELIVSGGNDPPALLIH